MLAKTEGMAEQLRDCLDYPHHQKDLLDESGIHPRVVLERGYRTEKTKAELERLGFSKEQQRAPALLIPMYSPTGKRTTCQIKPDAPRKDKYGKPNKYETPNGSEIRLDVHPSQVERIKDPSVPLWVTEGVKKGDCLVSHGQCAVVLQGVWCWQKGGVLLRDWEDIKLHGRKVIVAFDSDVITNPKVQKALEGLVGFLRSWGAKVKVLYLPDKENGEKQGVDDYLASGRTIQELARYVEDGLRDNLREIGKSLADVKPEKVEWLWPRLIPYAKLTLIDGDPGTGKSAMTTDLAARVSGGYPLPDGTPCEPSGVVLLSAEDGLAEAIRPRLEAAGADLELILALAMVPDKDGSERLLSIPEDLDTIRRSIVKVQARLIIVDPMVAFLSSGVNSHRDQDVRRALAPLAKLAEDTGAAVVVIRHLTKNEGGNPLYRGGGSIGIMGAARSALLVAKHPEDDRRRVLASLKSNLVKPAPSLAFTLVEADNGAVRVRWKDETPLDAAALLAAPTDDEERRELIALRDTVVELLEDSGGSWEGEPKEVWEELADRDLAALPERPDELTKRLFKLARSSTVLEVSRARKRKEKDKNKVGRVLRLRLCEHPDPEPPNGGNGVHGVHRTDAASEGVNTVNAVNADGRAREPSVHTEEDPAQKKNGRHVEEHARTVGISTEDELLAPCLEEATRRRDLLTHRDTAKAKFFIGDES